MTKLLVIGAIGLEVVKAAVAKVHSRRLSASSPLQRQPPFEVCLHDLQHKQREPLEPADVGLPDTLALRHILDRQPEPFTRDPYQAAADSA